LTSLAKRILECGVELTSLATKKPQRARWVEEVVRNLILQLVAESFNSAFEVTSLPAERREHGGFLRRL